MKRDLSVYNNEYGTDYIVVTAMSGGVDSSTAAFLMRGSGCRTMGAMMLLTGNESPDDAQAVAAKLEMPFRLYDMRDEFRYRVMDGFVRSYERGETPNPCVICNRHLKFGALYDAIYREMSGCAAISINSDPGVQAGGMRETCPSTYDCGMAGARPNAYDCGMAGARPNAYDCGNIVAAPDQILKLATGHYAVTEQSPGGRWMLRKASDLSKDQSYFLYALSQEQLSRTLFPLGSYTKAEIRETAESAGLINARRKDSQDICFVPDGDYPGFICRYTGHGYPPGEFADADGNVVGHHKGIIHYTIGQRKGLGIALGKPAYVLDIDAASNRVILGDNADLFSRELEAHDFNWVSMAAPAGEFRASARIRYRHHESPALIIPLSEDKVRVIFDDPQRAITRGQSVVIYDGEYVLGGGVIS